MYQWLQAFSIMEEDLGRPLEQVFSSISERPIAAASLGQVGFPPPPLHLMGGLIKSGVTLRFLRLVSINWHLFGKDVDLPCLVGSEAQS